MDIKCLIIDDEPLAVKVIENYLKEFINKHSDFDEAKIMNIIDKSLCKMTIKGRQRALTMIKLSAE